MKTPKEYLTRGEGNFIHCTDYDDAIKAMQEYADQFAIEFGMWINQNYGIDVQETTTVNKLLTKFKEQHENK